MPVTQLAERYGISYAAQFFGVSTDTVYRWVSEGRVSHYRLGTKIQFTQDQLDQALKAAERPATVAA